MMNANEAVLAVLDALEACGLPYMLVGSFSSNTYGIERSTKDADFVVELGSRSISQLLPHLGPNFQLDPQIRFETVTGTTRYDMRIKENPFTIEFFDLSQDPHDQERFRRRQSVEMLGRTVWLPRVEDVIVTKLRCAGPCSGSGRRTAKTCET